MPIGYTQPLFVLACDHRTSFAKLLEATWPMPPATRAEAARLKELVLEALVRAVRSGPAVAGAALSLWVARARRQRRVLARISEIRAPRGGGTLTGS